MSELKEKVVDIIVKKLGVERTQVTDDASFTKDLGADSLDTVELIMEFEKEFNITIEDSDAEKIQKKHKEWIYLLSLLWQAL